MTEQDRPSDFRFPRWANMVIPALLVAVVGGAPYVLVLVGFGAAPSTLNVNYQPEQPIAYSHELHVNQLGMDCRYCHTTVEDASFAAIPSTSVCMNCHHGVLKGTRAGSESDIATIREHYYEKDPITGEVSEKAGMPIEWVKVHDLPDYAYFDHSAHVSRGVSCVSCHGRVDRMGGEGVYQKAELSMGWCLSCHRHPEPHLRFEDEVTDLMWGVNLTEEEVGRLEGLGLEGLEVGGRLTDDQRERVGAKIRDENKIRSARQLQDCSLCHR